MYLHVLKKSTVFAFPFRRQEQQVPNPPIPVHAHEYTTARAGTRLARPPCCCCRTQPRGGSGEEVARHAERTVSTAILEYIFPAGQAAETCIGFRPGVCTRTAGLLPYSAQYCWRKRQDGPTKRVGDTPLTPYPQRVWLDHHFFFGPGMLCRVGKKPGTSGTACRIQCMFRRPGPQNKVLVFYNMALVFARRATSSPLRPWLRVCDGSAGYFLKNELAP